MSIPTPIKNIGVITASTVGAGFVAVGSVLTHAALLSVRCAAYAVREAKASHLPCIKHEVTTAVDAAAASIEAARQGGDAFNAVADTYAAGIADAEYGEQLKRIYDIQF